MLRRLFRSKDRLGDADPRNRREAVLALDAGRARAEADRLARMLVDDPDRAVRLAVIERIDAIDVLSRVLDDAAVGDVAARRIAALAKAQGRPLPDHPRLQSLGLAQANPQEQQARIAGIDDPEQLIALALKDRGSLRAAVLAHPALQTAAALGLLEKRSRGADKSLNRHAREALDGIRRLQHQAAAAAQRVEELVTALHRAAALSDQAAWEREQQLYQQCGAALTGYDEARAALAGFGEVLPALDELRARIAPPTPRPPPPAASALPPVADSTASTATAASAHADEETRSALQRSDESQLAAEPEDIGAASVAGSATESDETGTGTRQADAEPTAAAAAERAAAAAAERAARQAAAAARQADFDAVDALLGTGEDELAAGQVNAARQKLQEARQRLAAVEGEVPRRLARRLNRLGASLAELRDWQTYVTSPKREALCEAVQALVDRPLPPPDQAERLKALRAEWRELGPVAQRSDVALGERFNALAEQAFEPCRAYFAQQAEVRKANLAERERICDQLARYIVDTDWQRADMRAAEQILRAAREAWRHHSPVERSAAKTVEARFEGLQADLHGRLKAFWDRNGEAKQRLVTEARALLADAGDLEGRIDRIKGLQQQWKAVGPTVPRARDQALWQDFRAACDALFEARVSAKSAADAETRQLAGQCAAVLDDFEAELAALAPETASEAQARTLRERLDLLDRLPAALRQPLVARRTELLGRHQALLRARGRAAQRNRLLELRDRDIAFSLAEAAHRDGGPAPQAPERCFAPRLDRQGDAVPLDALRRLTLRAEQAAGIAAPPEDEALRLEVQVERLRGGLQGTEDETPLALAERWCGLGPKDAGVDGLRARFFEALLARQAAG